MTFGSPRPAGQRLREYAEDVIDDAASQVNYGPYVLPEVVAALAADNTPALAAAQAVTDEIAGRDILEGGDIVEPEIAFAVVDEDGRRTWIEAGTDGGGFQSL